MQNKIKNRPGFTLVELMVVVSIVSLLSLLTLVNFRAGESQLKLQRSGHKLAQDVRKSQEMAISAKEFQGVVPKGYGVYFNANQPNQYILFADLDGGKDYDIGEAVEVLALENKIKIDNLSPATPLTIVFSPPDPAVSFSPDAAAVSIVLRSEVPPLNQKTVQVNKAGLIYVE